MITDAQIRRELQASLLRTPRTIEAISRRVQHADERDKLIRKLGRYLRDAIRFVRDGKGRDAERALEKLDEAQRQFLDHVEATMTLLAVDDASNEKLTTTLRERFRAGEEEVRHLVLSLAAEVTAPLPSKKKEARNAANR